MSNQPPPAAGVRIPWSSLPQRIPAALEDWLGAPVVKVAMQGGGFSPGVAARVTSARGRRVFVKSLGPELNPDAPDIFREEARIVAVMPATAPVPRLLWLYDEGPGGWVMLVFEDIEGWNPAQPWRQDELDRVIEAIVGLAGSLTPSPIQAPAASDVFASHICGWRQILLEELSPQLDPWSARHLEDLATLEALAPAAAEGTTLLHFDIRADNILLTPEGVFFVDWPSASIGASWIDLAACAPSVAMQGGPQPEDLLMRHPAAREADPDAITAVIAAVAGYFTQRALLPPPPGLPTLRAFQAAQGIEARRWLAQRTGRTD